MRQFVVPPRDSDESHASDESAEASVEPDNIASTALYVVGVIAVIPVAGLMAWVVRTVLRRKVTTERSSHLDDINTTHCRVWPGLRVALRLVSTDRSRRTTVSRYQAELDCPSLGTALIPSLKLLKTFQR